MEGGPAVGGPAVGALSAAVATTIPLRRHHRETAVAQALASTRVFTDPRDGCALVTVIDAARLTGMTPRTVHRWMALGRVRTRTLAGSRWRRVELLSLWERPAERPADGEDGEDRDAGRSADAARTPETVP